MKVTLKLSTIVSTALVALALISGLLVYIHDRDMIIIGNNTTAIIKLNTTLTKFEKTIEKMLVIDSIYANDIEDLDERITVLEK